MKFRSHPHSLKRNPIELMAVNPGSPPKRVTMKAFGPSRTKRIVMPAIKNPRKKSRGPNTKRLIKLGKLLDSPKTRTRAKRVMLADGLKKMLAVNPRKKVKKNSSARKHARRPKKNPRVRLQKMESSMKYRRRKKNPKKRARRNPSKSRKIRRMRRNPGKKQKAAIKKLAKNLQESATKSADAAKGRRKGKKSKGKGGKRRSAAQRAATKKLIALNKSKKGSKKSKSKKSKSKSKSKSKGRRASIKRMGRKGRKGGKKSRRYVSSAKGYSIAIHRKSGLSAGNKKAYNAMLSSAKANPSMSGALAAAKEIFPQIGAGAAGLLGLGFIGMKANEMLQKQSFSSYIPGPIKPYSGAIITGALTAGAYMLAGRVKPLAKYKGAIAIGGGIAALVQILLATKQGQDLLAKAGFPSMSVNVPAAPATTAGFGEYTMVGDYTTVGEFPHNGMFDRTSLGEYTMVGSGGDNDTRFANDSLRGLDDRTRFANDSLSGMDDSTRFAPGEGGILSGKMF